MLKQRSPLKSKLTNPDQYNTLKT